MLEAVISWRSVNRSDASWISPLNLLAVLWKQPIPLFKRATHSRHDSFFTAPRLLVRQGDPMDSMYLFKNLFRFTVWILTEPLLD